eukprot:CAMPEP_0184870438 /NCGR_PEP_ID=MMETSP0580-20130426/37454_1 /TAXON_ID=1118495 /ORGANISM="Dactyliosolen fragilissimus" /LENGTH=611 /DNA_ID=CAMNT_0027372495 /DNA_START=273 /DNA_END=2105 /DNA_ORIENTATION=-
MTKEAAELRSEHVKKKKPILSRKSDSASKWLFPGISPEEYELEEEIPVFVELVDSMKTRVPYNYYNLPVCQRTKNASTMITKKNKEKRKNLGQNLMGMKTEIVDYEIHAGRSTGCQTLCIVEIPPTPLKFLRKLVKQQYRVHLTLDHLPILMRSAKMNYAIRGYPLGFVVPPGMAEEPNRMEETYYLYNHLRFSIYYTMVEDGFELDSDGKVEGIINDNMNVIGDNRSIRITAFDVFPVSVNHELPVGEDDQVMKDTVLATCDPSKGPVLNDIHTYLPLETGSAGDPLVVTYSYEVAWFQSDVKWADRWDIYLMESPDNEIHYFSIVNSLMFTTFLISIVAVIMVRALRRDLAEQSDLEELTTEESGWKLLHGDVFRPPNHRLILSVVIGTGCQIGTSVVLNLLFFTLKLIPIMKKGQVLTSILLLYVFTGSIAGYTSARAYKYFQGKGWKRNTLTTAALFPGMLVTLFIFLNLFLTYKGAATAVSLFTIFKIFSLWICASTPLVFIGSYFGFRADKIEVPTRTNQILRFIPESNQQVKTFRKLAFLSGILPFGAVCVEIYFIMGALWLHQIYFIMSFLLVACLILTATSSTVSMVLTYYQLCHEDHRWWW